MKQGLSTSCLERQLADYSRKPLRTILSKKMAEHYPSLSLPRECWELIIGKVSRSQYMEAISLVSKEFLSICNDIQSVLEVTDSNVDFVPQLAKRFKNIESLLFRASRGILLVDHSLLEVARSGWNLRALQIDNQVITFPESLRELGSNMQNLTTFGCSELSFRNGIDPVIIAEAFPCLEWLTVCNIKNWAPEKSKSIDDDAIEVIAAKLKNLRRISLSGRFSDKSVVAFALNCLSLSRVWISKCRDVTEYGIGFLLRHCRNLVCLYVNGIGSNNSGFTIANSIAYAEKLETIKLLNFDASDNLLSSIAKSGLPLRDIHIDGFKNCSFNGLVLLLRAYPSLPEISIAYAKYVTKTPMENLSQYLQKATDLTLVHCESFTNCSFSVVMKNCPSLEILTLGETGLGRGSFAEDRHSNETIRKLHLRDNYYLDDETLRVIGSSCPNLRFLQLQSSQSITSIGLEEILKRCDKIKELNLVGYRDAKVIRADSEITEMGLEVLSAVHSMISDEGLGILAKKCPKLMEVRLVHCPTVTNDKLYEMIGRCKSLRRLSLCKCKQFPTEDLAWFRSINPFLSIDFC